MNSLANITASTPAEEAGSILAYGLAEKSEATRRAYRPELTEVPPATHSQTERE